jgi:hypothetical protein
MRSNASGIGSRVAARVQTRWTVLGGVRSHSGPGQSLQPLLLGLGGASAADFVTILWSDGVLQTELDLAAGDIRHIAEKQRQISSCPVLFAYDGVRFAFVSDLLGVGGIGYAVGPGDYSTPRPWEHLLLPAGLPKSTDGRLALKLAEPMEEVTYLDAARLVAWDLPPGWRMTVDDRMAIAGPQPTGEPLFYRRMVLPTRAVNQRGDNVTAAVVTVDRKAAPVGELDSRFIGLLASEHVLDIHFDVALDELGGQAVLLADGWIEYPYSQTNFAAWQAGAEYQAPTLEARGADGRWRVVLEQFGYPAGMPRQMALPLPPLPKGTRSLRLRTTQEVYWDRLAVVAAEPCPEARRTRQDLLDAVVRDTGFARRIHRAQNRPDYDYNRRVPLWDAHVQAGWYTRLGPVGELVAAADDAIVIFGPGDELHLEFAASSDVDEGWSRRFVFEAQGWCKDMDLYTRDGATVAPLPTAHGASAERDRLMAEFTTRYRLGTS